MEEDDINMFQTIRYSKKYDARRSCTFAKTVSKFQRNLARIKRKPSVSDLRCMIMENKKPICFLLKSQTMDSAESKLSLALTKHQDVSLIWNLNHVRASRLAWDLGRTNAFAMLID